MTEFNLYKFGVMVEALDMSQKCFHLVKQLNNIVDEDCQFSPIVFYSEYAKHVDVNRFGMLLDQKVWAYDGVVIATSLKSAEILLNCPCPKRKFLYVWNLDWLYNQYVYQYLQHIYQGELELIARNTHHAKVITTCWKRPAYIMDNFDSTILKQIIRGKNNND